LFDSAHPFKSERDWGKVNLTEGGIRIPMVAQWTGKIEPGTKTDLLSVHIDVLPTLCELVGTEPEGNIDGISFLPTLLGGGNQKQHAFFYWEFPAWLFKCDVQGTIVRNAICGRLHKERM
jgi:arylsulfatase A-like enzyme